MKILFKFFLLCIIGVSLISCDGKTTTPKGKQNTESKVQNDSLYKTSITGDKVENGLNETFVQAVINDVISRRINYFYNLSNHYFFEAGMGNDPELPINCAIRHIIRIKYAEPVSELKSSDELIFDNNGVIKSHISTDFHHSYRNGIISHSQFIDIEDFQVEYLSENPIKFKSITIIETRGEGEPKERDKLSFSYDSSGMLQSIVTFYASTEKEHINFSYYRNGVMAGNAFYTFFEINPSIPKEYYSDGTLLYKRTIDSDGNKYVIDAHSHANRGDTIRIYDKNNRILCFHDEGPIVKGIHFYPKYQEMGDGSMQTEYTKLDNKGNWINSETYFVSVKGRKTLHSKLEREISYY